jgi:hypothetical protein
LRYVEGLARVLPLESRREYLIGHAWVTLDGVHAIDLTWRGQQVTVDGRTFKATPATEYYGVEIPIYDVRRLFVENGNSYLVLADWYREQERRAA